eukprot:778672-Rhodomonas_salina.1
MQVPDAHPRARSLRAHRPVVPDRDSFQRRAAAHSYYSRQQQRLHQHPSGTGGSGGSDSGRDLHDTALKSERGERSIADGPRVHPQPLHDSGWPGLRACTQLEWCGLLLQSGLYAGPGLSLLESRSVIRVTWPGGSAKSCASVRVTCHLPVDHGSDDSDVTVTGTDVEGEGDERELVN